MNFLSEQDFTELPKEKRQVNLTPLIDMMFLLVIFFMLSTTFGLTNLIDINLKDEKNFDGAMAGHKPVEGAGKIEPILITLDMPGHILFNGKAVQSEELDMQLASSLKKNPGREIHIEAGSGIAVQNLVALLDRVEIFGGANVSLREKIQ